MINISKHSNFLNRLRMEGLSVSYKEPVHTAQ